MGPTGLNLAQSEAFRHFLEFESSIFLELAYNNRLQQCLMFSRDEIQEKNLGGQNLDKTSQN